MLDFIGGFSMEILKCKIKFMKKIKQENLMRYGNIFYKSYYINNAEFRIYRSNNKFKLYIFENRLMDWICIGKFDNPRQVIREIDYIISGNKTKAIREWFDDISVNVKYIK